jgi:hypothetical protein
MSRREEGQSMNSKKESQRPTARKTKQKLTRIRQGDIFGDIEVIEKISIVGDKLVKDALIFPYVVCLNQECDLLSDYRVTQRNKDSSLLHLAIAPAFNFDQYLSGSHWGRIFNGEGGKRDSSRIQLIMKNEIPRYHYLYFAEGDMPEMIVDFKHFFTINRDVLYDQMDKRICSLEDLFREKISQRFSYYLSRIGLPDE